MQAVRDAQPATPGTVVRAQAPLRLSFVGGGTDFPHYYRRHGGAVLSSTVDLYARVRVTARDDHQVVIRSHDLGHRVEYHLKEGPPPDGVLDLAKAAVERAGLRRGIDMAIECDAPPGSGLGGSSAVVTAIVAALSALAGHELPPRELAEVAHDVERVDAGIVGGEQDHYAAAFGGLILLEFTSAGVRVEPVAVDPAVQAALQERLLFCYTGGVRTNLGLIDRQIEMFERGR